MRERPEAFKGKKGVSGRKTVREEKSFFQLLDASLPSTIIFCRELVEKGKLANKQEPTYRQDKELALQASKILMSKAPNRTDITTGGKEIITGEKVNELLAVLSTKKV